MSKISEFKSESDQEIFSGMNLNELQEIKDENHASSSPFDRILDDDQLKIRRGLKDLSEEAPASPDAIDQFDEFM